MKLVSVTEMVQIEAAAAAAGLSYAEMMENAGQALAASIVRIAAAEGRAQRAIGLVGPGNNGGDTLIALRELATGGWHAVALLAMRRPLTDPLAQDLEAAGGRALLLDDLADLDLRDRLAAAAFFLDGLLGTGAHPPLKPAAAIPLARLGALLAELPRRPYRIAVDCPSGIDCNTGDLPTETILADRTITMAAAKLGMLRLPAFRAVGELEVVSINLPPDMPELAQISRLALDAAAVRSYLPPRPLDAHKGTFGTALIVAGSLRYPGAALLASEAAYRVGAGLVTVAVPAPLQTALAGHLPEATWLPLPTQEDGFAPNAADRIALNLARPTALLLGPGLGDASGVGPFVAALLKQSLPPLVIDADGLNRLAELDGWSLRLPPETILTPHPGEMSRLTGLPTDAIQAERLAIAEEWSRRWNCVVILKGALTVVAGPQGSAVLPSATPALARAGTGDVLAGIVTGLRAQGVPAFGAACLGVWLHAACAQAALLRRGHPAAVLAGDLAPELGSVLAHLAATA